MTTSRATSFGEWAEEYDRWRPTYPDAGETTVPLTHDALCVRWRP
jgi:hypothetical protein